MASIDDELLHDRQESLREAAFIRRRLPDELAKAYTDEDLVWMIDAVASYFYESGILEADDDEVDIDLEAAARYICELAATEGRQPLTPEDVLPVVEADLDFQEEEL